MTTSTANQYEIVEHGLSRAVLLEAAATLGATRRHDVELSRMEWLYQRNPDGEAVLWAIREGELGKMVGFTVALPRRMHVDGQERKCWNGADFSILSKYRTLGLAIKLRRAAKAGVDKGQAAFLYAHPNEKMAVIHTKVGHAPIGKMIRIAYVLRSARYLHNWLHNRWLTNAAAALVDPSLRLQGREWRHRTGTRVEFVDNIAFDDRFDRLFEESAPRSGVLGMRDSRYLNWRYAENPVQEFHALLAMQRGELVGYLVFHCDGEMLSIKDVYPPHNPDVACDLVAAVIREGRRMKLQSVTFTALETNPLIRVFSKCGFRQRSSNSQMFAYAPGESPIRARVLDSDAWLLTVGDRDV